MTFIPDKHAPWLEMFKLGAIHSCEVIYLLISVDLPGSFHAQNATFLQNEGCSLAHRHALHPAPEEVTQVCIILPKSFQVGPASPWFSSKPLDHQTCTLRIVTYATSLTCHRDEFPGLHVTSLGVRTL